MFILSNIGLLVMDMHNESKLYNKISRLLKIGKSTVAKMISPTYQKTNVAMGRLSLIGKLKKKWLLKL